MSEKQELYKGVPIVYGTEVGPQAQKSGIDRASSKPKYFDENWRTNPELSVKERAVAERYELEIVAYLLKRKQDGFSITEAQEAKLGRILEATKKEKKARSELLLGQGAVEKLMIPDSVGASTTELAQARLARKHDMADVQPAFRSKD